MPQNKEETAQSWTVNEESSQPRAKESLSERSGSSPPLNVNFTGGKGHCSGSYV